MAGKLGQNNVPRGGLASGIIPAFYVFAVWESFNLTWTQQSVPATAVMPAKM